MGIVLTATTANQMNSSDKIALAALFVAIVSLVSSIVGIVLQKKMNTINLEASYYQKIFDKYILDEIPKKVSELKFDSNKKLNRNYQDLNHLVMQMVRDAKYFSFSNPKFYDKLSKLSMKLDDKLVIISGKTVERVHDQNQLIEEIEKSVSEIVVYINRNYAKKM